MLPSFAVLDDAELLRRWRSGDTGAGDALLRSCFPSLSRFFRDKVTGEEEDLVQQTLLGCVESRETIRDASQFRVFMFRIARNRLYDRLRRQLRLDERIVVADTSLHDMGASPSSMVARDERQHLMLEALRRIPLEQQLVLELSYWEGLTAKEIGEVLEVNPNTVRSRLHRAREALREQLATMGVSELEAVLPR